MPVPLSEADGVDLDRVFQFDQRRILLTRPAVPELVVQGVELVGELRADVGQDLRRQLIEIRGLGDGQPNNRSARALEQDVVVRLDAQIGRSPVDTETRLDGLSSFENRRQEGLDEDGQVYANLDLRFGQVPG